MFNFSKQQRLCNKGVIEKIFFKGNKFFFDPILFLYKEVLDSNVPIKVLISVPKKNIKLSVNRNVIKRRVKEAYRKNKYDLERELIKKGKQLHLVIIFQENKIESYGVLQEKIKLGLDNIKNKI